MKRAERVAVFHREFLEDLRFWVKTDRIAALRILELVDATLRDPFLGIGKPEALKYGIRQRNYTGVSPEFWSVCRQPICIQRVAVC